MRKLICATAVAAVTVASGLPALAEGEQFIPVLSYRTGAYAVNGVPFANGNVDYLALLNERDGGINGVKVVWEECETGYATDKGVECYERLKSKGTTGAAYFSPLSTGITFALTEKVTGDKIPLLTLGYGRSESRNGAVFPWNFIAMGSYWTGADIAVQHIAKEMGGFDKLKGKKISLVYHDSPYGKEPIPALEAFAAKYGFTFKGIPVTHPGVEQKSQWLSIRQDRPDYVLLWGWGVMNGTAIKEAAAVAYPREKVIGIWWSGAEPDVIPAGDGAKGYKALMLQHGPGQYGIHAELKKHLLDKGKALGKEDFAQVLYNRGLINSFIGTEALESKRPASMA
jgi:branched-chain amino acid transport system substrate-binding protein